jgi:hypothetical protein
MSYKSFWISCRKEKNDAFDKFYVKIWPWWNPVTPHIYVVLLQFQITWRGEIFDAQWSVEWLGAIPVFFWSRAKQRGGMAGPQLGLFSGLF